MIFKLLLYHIAVILFAIIFHHNYIASNATTVTKSCPGWITHYGFKADDASFNYYWLKTKDWDPANEDQSFFAPDYAKCIIERTEKFEEISHVDSSLFAVGYANYIINSGEERFGNFKSWEILEDAITPWEYCKKLGIPSGVVRKLATFYSDFSCKEWLLYFGLSKDNAGANWERAKQWLIDLDRYVPFYVSSYANFLYSIEKKYAILPVRYCWDIKKNELTSNCNSETQVKIAKIPT